MADKPRGRPVGPRARGIPKQKTGEMPLSRPGPPSEMLQTVPQPAPKKPTPRGRGSGQLPTAEGSLVGASGPSRPTVEELKEKMAAVTIASRGGPSGSGEASRGGRQDPGLRELLVTKPSAILKKQGAYGKPVGLIGNFFAVQSLTDYALYQYRVDFLPDEERIRVRKAYLRQHQELLGAHIFDGTVLYLLHRLPQNPTELVVVDKMTEQPVKITIKLTTDCSPGDYHYLQVWGIIFRRCLESMQLQLVGRDYYDAAAKVVLKEYNLEIWPGYVSSIRQHEQQILLNVDTSSKIMRNDTALDLLNECKQRTGNNFKESYANSIIRTTVITRYNNATYFIDDVDFNSTPKTTFDMKGTPITYIDYYKTKYGLNIRDTEQPLLISKPKAKDIRGGRDRLTILVPELCCLTGITDAMRSNFQMMRALADHTKLRPSKRIELLEKGFMQRMSSTPAAKDELKKWNIRFSPTLLRFSGRNVAEEEVIVLAGGGEAKPDRDADFTRSLRDHRMVSCGDLRNWVVIYPQRISREVEPFCMTLNKAGRSLGFQVPQPQLHELPDDRANTYVDAIEKCIQRYQPTLIMCVLMNNKGDRYEAIKRKCYVDRSIPSQCVLAKNLSSKGVMSICTKIAIQLNCKIGGIPWSVKIPFKKPVMITGFDVTHDTKVKGKSVGAFVASLNQTYSRYFSAVSMHSSGEELSNDIATQMCKAIAKFQTFNNGEVPSKIIMYRDGVGDGNIHFVLNHEISLIKEKIKTLYPEGEEIKIIFVVVTKKVNTRIFAGMENPPPGTIVDDVITKPERYDFYLVSQSVKQGTVAPTYYNVIYDTTGQTPDTTQRLTYKLTHMYFNWSGTVRVPAPVQYAHKLAFLVGQSLHRVPSANMDDLLYFL